MRPEGRYICYRKKIKGRRKRRRRRRRENHASIFDDLVLIITDKNGVGRLGGFFRSASR
jgi:hypothetical protein